jgi:hypothetical protein
LQIHDPATGKAVPLPVATPAITAAPAPAAAGSHPASKGAKQPLAASSSKRSNIPVLHHKTSKAAQTAPSAAAGAAAARRPVAITDPSTKAVVLPAAAATGSAAPASAAAAAAVAAVRHQQHLQIRGPSRGKVVEVQPTAKAPWMQPPAAGTAAAAATTAVAAVGASSKRLDIIEPRSNKRVTIVQIPPLSLTTAAEAAAAQPLPPVRRPVEIGPPAGKRGQHSSPNPAADVKTAPAAAAAAAADGSSHASSEGLQPIGTDAAKAADEPVPAATSGAGEGLDGAVEPADASRQQQQQEAQASTASSTAPDDSNQPGQAVPVVVPVAVPIAVRVAVPVAAIADVACTLLPADDSGAEAVGLAAGSAEHLAVSVPAEAEAAGNPSKLAGEVAAAAAAEVAEAVPAEQAALLPQELSGTTVQASSSSSEQQLATPAAYVAERQSPAIQVEAPSMQEQPADAVAGTVSDPVNKPAAAGAVAGEVSAAGCLDSV